MNKLRLALIAAVLTVAGSAVAAHYKIGIGYVFDRCCVEPVCPPFCVR